MSKQLYVRSRSNDFTLYKPSQVQEQCQHPDREAFGSEWLPCSECDIKKDFLPEPCPYLKLAPTLREQCPEPKRICTYRGPRGGKCPKYRNCDLTSSCPYSKVEHEQEKQCLELEVIDDVGEVTPAMWQYLKGKPTPTLRKQMPLIKNLYWEAAMNSVIVPPLITDLAQATRNIQGLQRDADMAWHDKRLEELAEYIKSGKWIGTGEEGDDVCSLLARYILKQREG